MDSIVDKDYYDKEYCGEPIDNETSFDRYLKKAMRQVNKYCNFYFDKHTVDELPFDSDRDAVKNSICAQIEYFIELGSSTELAGDGQVTSIHVGQTTKNFGHVNLDKATSMVSNQALEYLAPTGLLYRGVGQYD